MKPVIPEPTPNNDAAQSVTTKSLAGRDAIEPNAKPMITCMGLERSGWAGVPADVGPRYDANRRSNGRAKPIEKPECS